MEAGGSVGAGGEQAEDTVANQGQRQRGRFQVTCPGLFVYHCAVPDLDYHISSGMFGCILVEPEGGLPAVDHEFDFDSMAMEAPTYVLVNGEKYGIGPQGYNDMVMETDETARVYYGVGGPNLFSSFHPIGSVWDEVYPQGAIMSDPHRYVQTTPVLPGSAMVGTLTSPVPLPIKLVDHALSRVARKGCLAVIDVQGEADPTIYDPNPA
ncbi:hypothetical protein N0B31_00290 [Salinirubellus salinus]|uniref:Plastocyanin-like domain-containing protein n=1 Tax=Salinirubellus salinus TaxID=1364945 RepID=A0A9E7R2W7_9EURY|nr:hypothetical protein [Salinirubellus salinus]UWM54666.1 hypothetical protein N0B31_21420 [Salinirubellus salinus]UWM54734.1 hypothetical protein N0B31_00290 [Salinirubellus salinus]